MAHRTPGSMQDLSLLINTQTPLVQFPATASPTAWAPEVDLASLREGVDYRFSPGGVTRMVYPLVRRMMRQGIVGEAHWISLNPNAPPIVRLPGLTLHSVSIDTRRLGGYGKAKEAIWSTAHGLVDPTVAQGLFWTDDFAEYTYYNRTTAEKIEALDREHDFDLFYVHDFQQLPIGQMLGTLKPKIFRWHIPFDLQRIPEEWEASFVTYLDAYDAIVVSSDAYRRALERFGRSPRVVRMYPYVDPEEYGRPARTASAALARRLGLDPHDLIALVVARMDPAKGQDHAIAAVAEVAHRFPRLRLVLVGNGSFSASRAGLALSKGARWREHLERTVRTLGVEDRVVFTGHVSQADLDALYDLCTFTILPSVNEGFGLVVVESWLHRRPTLVTRRAGVAELIGNDDGGLLFDPETPGELAAAIVRILEAGGGLRRHLVERGVRLARRCSLDAAVAEEARLFARMVGG